MTLKIQGPGDEENRPKSDQVIYRSGPTIVLKMKEIQKVVKRLSREQESAAGGGGVGGVRTGTKHKITTPAYRGDLTNLHDQWKLFEKMTEDRILTYLPKVAEKLGI